MRMPIMNTQSLNVITEIVASAMTFAPPQT